MTWIIVMVGLTDPISVVSTEIQIKAFIIGVAREPNDTSRIRSTGIGEYGVQMYVCVIL